jgi:hypothetical protein
MQFKIRGMACLEAAKAHGAVAASAAGSSLLVVAENVAFNTAVILAGPSLL